MPNLTPDNANNYDPFPNDAICTYNRWTHVIAYPTTFQAPFLILHFARANWSLAEFVAYTDGTNQVAGYEIEQVIRLPNDIYIHYCVGDEAPLLNEYTYVYTETLIAIGAIPRNR